MSHSRRHAPVVPMTCAESEKQDKVLAHRAFRRVTRQALHGGIWELLPHEWTYANPYNWAKDGCQMYWDGDWRRWWAEHPWRFWMK